MRRILVAMVTIAAASWSAEPRLAAQKQQQQQIFISLIGSDGTPVMDLQATDVKITEDGTDCKVVKLEPIDWPTKLQVLVDNGKNNTTPINPLRDGLKSLFEQMPPGVAMSLYTTAPQPRPIVKEPTTDKQKLIEGISRIAPDSGAGAFFDALSEAADRIDKDKAPSFPVLLMVGSDQGRNNFLDRDYQKLQENIIKHAIGVHVIVTSAGAGSSSGGVVQTEVGLALTKMTGGHYDTINVATRLSTLLPEYGKRIAESAAKQTHQYRVTYERPANAKAAPQIGASVGKPGTPVLTINGRIP
jgi:hypothetical protein